jgi:hypothetical protein
MTGVALPINATAGSPSYDARAFRAATAGNKAWDGAPLAGRTGLRPMGGSAANVVTLSGSTITVGLHAGEIAPGWAATTSSYSVALTVAETHSLTPAHATNPRKDIVVGRVYDDDESASGLKLYRSEYIAGTAGPSPAEPAVPQGAIRLATIDVPFLGNGSAVVTTNFLYTVAAGGILPVRSVTGRDGIVNPYTGMIVYRQDRGWLEMYDGTAWRLHRSVVAVDSLAQVPNPISGQLVFYTVDQNWQRYNGTTWAPLNPAPATASQAASGTTTSTTFTNTLTTSGAGPGVAFTAPPSGRVTVENTANLISSTVASLMSFEIRAGSSVGTGTVVVAAIDENGPSVGGGNSGSRYTLVLPLSGLTPGGSYNIRQMYRVSAGGTGGTFIQKRITVKADW